MGSPEKQARDLAELESLFGAPTERETRGGVPEYYLQNAETGEYEKHALTDATRAGVASGALQLPASSSFPLVSPEGKAQMVPGAMATKLLGEGWQLQGHVDDMVRTHYAAEEAKYGDSPLIAGTLGLARGASFGLTDAAAAAVGLEEQVAGYRDYNPTTSLITEGVGMVVPAALSGGASTAASGATAAGRAGTAARALRTGARATPAGAASRLGLKVERGLAGRATSGAGRVGATAAGTAVEGGIAGAGMGLSNAMLSEDPATAESLVSEIGLNAALGGGLGATIGAAGGLLREGLKARAARAATQTDDLLKQQDDLAASEAQAVMDEQAGFQAEQTALAEQIARDDEMLRVGKVLKEEADAIKHQHTVAKADLKAKRKAADDLADQLFKERKALLKRKLRQEEGGIRDEAKAIRGETKALKKEIRKGAKNPSEAYEMSEASYQIARRMEATGTSHSKHGLQDALWVNTHPQAEHAALEKMFPSKLRRIQSAREEVDTFFTHEMKGTKRARRDYKGDLHEDPAAALSQAKDKRRWMSEKEFWKLREDDPARFRAGLQALEELQDAADDFVPYMPLTGKSFKIKRIDHAGKKAKDLDEFFEREPYRDQEVWDEVLSRDLKELAAEGQKGGIPARAEARLAELRKALKSTEGRKLNNELIDRTKTELDVLDKRMYNREPLKEIDDQLRALETAAEPPHLKSLRVQLDNLKLEDTAAKNLAKKAKLAKKAVKAGEKAGLDSSYTREEGLGVIAELGLAELAPIEDIPGVGTELDWIIKAAIVGRGIKGFRARGRAEALQQVAARPGRAPKGLTEQAFDSATHAAAQAGSFGVFTGMGGRGRGLGRRWMGMLGGSLTAKGIKGALRHGMGPTGRASAEEILESAIARSQQTSRKMAQYLKGGKVARKVAVPSALKILNGISFGAAPKKGKDLQEAYKLRMEELSQAMGDPNTPNRLHETASGVGGDDLMLTDQVETSVMQRLKVISDAAPKSSRPSGMGRADTYRPSEKQIADWARVIRATDDPLSLVDDLLAEKVSYRALQAVKDSAPETWAVIREQSIEAYSEYKGNVVYRKRLLLSHYLEAPLDSSMEGDRVAALQSRHAPEQEEQQQGSPKLASIKAPAPTQAQRLQD